MSRALHVAIPVTLFVSVLALSACATKSEPAPVAATSQASVTAEKPAVAATQPVPAIAEQPALNPEPAPKHAAKKAKKKLAKVKPIAPQAEPPAPVAALAPAAVQEVPPVQPPNPPAPIVQPVTSVPEPGFMEQYWPWLAGLVVIIAGIVAWIWMSRKNAG